MFMDKNTGRIELPNGLVVIIVSDKAGFENLVCFSQATLYDYGALSFQWYRLDGTQLSASFMPSMIYDVNYETASLLLRLI